MSKLFTTVIKAFHFVVGNQSLSHSKAIEDFPNTSTSHDENIQRGKGQAYIERQNQLKLDFEFFEKEHPLIAEWWTESNFRPALDLRDVAKRNGGLTLSQIEHANRMIDAWGVRPIKPTTKSRPAFTPSVRMDSLSDTFKTALRNKSRNPKLRLINHTLTLQVTDRQNTILIEADQKLIGKILDGLFYKSYECTPVQEKEFIKISANPQAAAIAYGRLTGRCSICNRPLSADGSIELGIGPVCAKKYGFALN
jgi:Family of unknown function (DUF6011)